MSTELNEQKTRADQAVARRDAAEVGIEGLADKSFFLSSPPS